MDGVQKFLMYSFLRFILLQVSFILQATPDKRMQMGNKTPSCMHIWLQPHIHEL